MAVYENPTGTEANGDHPTCSPPTGEHPLEVAARAGFGPLNEDEAAEWHGNAIPCVSCGQLVRRTQTDCNFCGQDLGDEMIEKMRAHAGPWYVLEHVRPFPGVSLDRIIRQVRRGVLGEASIVRGPATDFQWRFAVETPGLCRYFGRCWRCHAEVAPSDSSCPACHSFLAFERPQASSARNARGSRPELEELSAVLTKSPPPSREAVWDEPPRLGRISATWVAAAVIVLVVIALLVISQIRTDDISSPPAPVTALMVGELPQA